MVDAQNDILTARVDLQLQGSSLVKLGDRIDRLRDSLKNILICDRMNNEDSTEKLEHIQSKLEVLLEKQQLVKLNISALEGSIESDQTRIQCMFEKAMKQANLLTEPEIRESDVESDTTDDERDDDDTSVAKDEPAEAVTNEEEKAVDDAKQNLYDAQLIVQRAQLNFDQKEWQYERNLEEYEAEVAAGECDMSRSAFDCRCLQINQNVTRALIVAEEEFYATMDHARKLGYRVNSPSYLSQEPDGGWCLPMSGAFRATVDAWIEKVDATNGPETVVTSSIDEWKFEPVGICDSISMVGGGPYDRDIARWNEILNDRWKEWRLETPEERDKTTGGYDVPTVSLELLGRRNSFYY